MDSIQVSGDKEISINAISLAPAASEKCSQVSDITPNSLKSLGSANLPLTEDLGNLTFHDDSINLSIKSKKENMLGHTTSNGIVHGINSVPDGKCMSINVTHQMDGSLADKSSQYQSCSNDLNDAALPTASSGQENIQEIETSHSKEEPSDCSVCPPSSETKEASEDSSDIRYVLYESELQMPDIMRLIQKDLSEPYSIYTYRYFIHNWPNLCYLAMHEAECVGAIVCKLDMHRKVVKRGYIAMLAVDEKYRKRQIGSNLVLKAIKAMVADKADEVVLETEITNQSALRLYENLGFVRDKRLFRYYLNGVDALRLKLWLR